MRIATLACLALCLALPASADPTPEAKARIEAAIRELGEDDFEAREMAERVIRRIGRACLLALREAALTAKDPEIRGRAGRLARAFEVEAISGVITAPLRLRLAVTDVSPAEAVARLAAVSKYPIRLRGDEPRRRVTLDTGDVTFWEALDALNRAAGLREVSTRVAAKAEPETIQLEAGADAPTSRLGSIRVRALPGTPGLTLNIQGEPRLRDFRVVPGSLRITKAVDDLGQTREAVVAPAEPPRQVGGIIIGGRALVVPPPATAQRTAVFHLVPGTKASNRLRELAGTVSITTEVETGLVATILAPLDSRGKAVAGRDGWALRLDAIRKLPDGGIEASATVTRPTSNPLEAMFGGKVRFGGRVVINGVEVGGESANATPAHPRLYDGEGRAYTLAAVSAGAVKDEGGKAERTFSLTYRPPAATSSPGRMTLSAIESVPTWISFRLAGVEIP